MNNWTFKTGNNHPRVPENHPIQISMIDDAEKELIKSRAIHWVENMEPNTNFLYVQEPFAVVGFTESLTDEQSKMLNATLIWERK